MNHQPERRTVTVPEAADLLGISRNSAYDAVKAGQIPAMKIGKRLLVPKAALDRMLYAEPAALVHPACPIGHSVNDGGQRRRVMATL
jgi:excisionase family DNA binding protein